MHFWTSRRAFRSIDFWPKNGRFRSFLAQTLAKAHFRSMDGRDLTLKKFFETPPKFYSPDQVLIKYSIY